MNMSWFRERKDGGGGMNLSWFRETNGRPAVIVTSRRRRLTAYTTIAKEVLWGDKRRGMN